MKYNEIHSHKAESSTVYPSSTSTSITGARITPHGIVLFRIWNGEQARDKGTLLEFVYDGYHYRQWIERSLSQRALALAITKFITTVMEGGAK